VGECVIGQAKAEPRPSAGVRFDIADHSTRIAVVEQFKGRAGWLTLQQLRIDSFEREEYLLCFAFDDDGHGLDQETAERLFACHGQVRAKFDPIFQEAGSFLEGDNLTRAPDGGNHAQKKSELCSRLLLSRLQSRRRTAVDLSG